MYFSRVEDILFFQRSFLFCIYCSCSTFWVLKVLFLREYLPIILRSLFSSWLSIAKEDLSLQKKCRRKDLNREICEEKWGENKARILRLRKMWRRISSKSERDVSWGYASYHAKVATMVIKPARPVPKSRAPAPRPNFPRSISSHSNFVLFSVLRLSSCK